jgi:hypothetical protein
MSIDSLIDLFEDLVFRILSWIIFIPKTYLLAIQPGKAPNYVVSHQGRARAERYDEIISPILFYTFMVLLGAIPIDPNSEVSPGDYLQRLLSLPEIQLIGAFILSFLLPIGVSIIVSLAQRLFKDKPILRVSLRRLFDTQCLLWGVFASIGPLVSLILNLLPKTWVGVTDFIVRFHQIPALVYFTLLQSYVVKKEFGLRLVYSFVLAGAAILVLRLFTVRLFGNPYAALFELAAPLN